MKSRIIIFCLILFVIINCVKKENIKVNPTYDAVKGKLLLRIEKNQIMDDYGFYLTLDNYSTSKTVWYMGCAFAPPEITILEKPMEKYRCVDGFPMELTKLNGEAKFKQNERYILKIESYLSHTPPNGGFYRDVVIFIIDENNKMRIEK
jgi:hypothetical protein